MANRAAQVFYAEQILSPNEKKSTDKPKHVVFPRKQQAIGVVFPGKQQAIEEAAKKAAGLPMLSEQLGERTTNWIHAQKPRETETGVSFDDPMLDGAAKSIFAVAAKQHEGLFKPRRERDILTAGLGNPEHPGCVRGISLEEG
jgi:hypothetical protein